MQNGELVVRGLVLSIWVLGGWFGFADWRSGCEWLRFTNRKAKWPGLGEFGQIVVEAEQGLVMVVVFGGARGGCGGTGGGAGGCHVWAGEAGVGHGWACGGANEIGQGGWKAEEIIGLGRPLIAPSKYLCFSVLSLHITLSLTLSL